MLVCRRRWIVVAAFVFVSSHAGWAAAAVTLKPAAISFNAPISVDYHAPTGQLVLSTNYFAGQPYNFELVASDGSRAQFSPVRGLIDEVYIATARTTHGGFQAGELFTGTGVAGQVARVSPDGASVLLPWVVLPGELGLLRGALHMDDSGVFGGDLLVATDTGSMWRVDGGGATTFLGSANEELEGLAVLPDDPRYGPWAGKAVSCNEHGAGFFAFDPAGGVTGPFDLGIPSCENITLVVPQQYYYLVDFTGQTLWRGAPDQFTDMIGDLLVGEEFPGNVWRVRWNPATASFDKELEATFAQLEGAAFAPVALPIVNTPPVVTCPPAITVAAAACAPPRGASVTVGVSVSDADGDPLTVTFTAAGATASHQLAGGATQDSFTFLAPPGTTAVTVAVRDVAGASATCSVPVMVDRQKGHDGHDRDHGHDHDHDHDRDHGHDRDRRDHRR